VSAAAPAATGPLPPVSSAVASKSLVASAGHADPDVHADTSTGSQLQPAMQENGVQAAASREGSPQEPPALSGAAADAAADGLQALHASAGQGAGCNGVGAHADAVRADPGV
jgi:hypothetical protein